MGYVDPVKHLEKMKGILGQQYFCSDNLPGEEWRPLTEWKGFNLKYHYQVSNKGRVKNYKGNIVPGNIDPWGYHVVSLNYADKNINKHSFMHSIVLTSFVGTCPKELINPTVNHKDHNPLNNCVENLEWMESGANSKESHAVKIRIIDEGIEYLFDSEEEASTIHCNRNTNYIGDCMKIGIPIRNRLDKNIDLFYNPVLSNEWIPYIPTKREFKPWKLACIIEDSSGIHRFDSISAASKYIGRKEWYLKYRYDNGLKSYSNFTGEEVSFKILSKEN